MVSVTEAVNLEHWKKHRSASVCPSQMLEVKQKKKIGNIFLMSGLDTLIF